MEVDLGATAHYKSLSPWALEQLKAHPWLVEPFVCWEPLHLSISPWRNTLPDDVRQDLVTKMAEAVPPELKNLALELWQKRKPEEFAIVQPSLGRLRSEWLLPGLDLDKAWRGVLSELDRCSPAVADVCTRSLSSGIALGPDLGYAPAEYHDTEVVAELASALPDAVAEYEGAAGTFAREMACLRDYYLDAAQRGYAMLLSLA